MKLLIIMVGVPGSGKSTIRDKLFPEATVVCPDDLIGYNKKSPWSFKAVKAAWKKADILLKQALNKGEEIVIFDATMISVKKRKKYIDLGAAKGFSSVALFCDAPEYLCRQRNDARDKYRRVPDNTMSSMIEKLVSPSLAEGFKLIITKDSISGVISDTLSKEALNIQASFWSATVKGGN